MWKGYYRTYFRAQCMDVNPLSMIQFDLCVKNFRGLLSDETIKNCKRIIASGCGDSYLAPAEAKEVFAHYLPDVEYVAPLGIDAGRYIHYEDKEENTIVVAVSVSGAPTRVAEILERGNAHGCTTIALTDNKESRLAKTGKYLYWTETPEGDNVSGLRTYMCNMMALYVMAAVMAEVRTGNNYVDELRKEIDAYREEFYRDIEKMDDVCFEAALNWKPRQVFECVGDGPMFYCGKFIAAKVAELSGDVCHAIDSENYNHVNGIMAPRDNIAEMDLIISYEPNCDRIVDTVNSQIKSGRGVIVFSDKDPKELGVVGEHYWCKTPAPRKEYKFLAPLFFYIPGSLLASYRSTTIGEPFFRGGGDVANMTLSNNSLKVY